MISETSSLISEMRALRSEGGRSSEASDEMLAKGAWSFLFVRLSCFVQVAQSDDSSPVASRASRSVSLISAAFR